MTRHHGRWTAAWLPGPGVRFEPATVEDVEVMGGLLARRLQLPALTADRAWADLDPGVDVQVIG